MIFLVFKIFVYLALALCLGAAGGWLLRNLAATRHEETLNRQLIEARGRVPQLESQLRGQGEMTSQLKAQIKEKEAQVGELNQALKERDEALVQKEREVTLLQARVDGRVDAKDGASASIRTDEHMLVLEEVEAEAESEVGPQAKPEPASPEDSLELLALKAEVNRLSSALDAAKSAAASVTVAAPATPAPVAESPELLNRIADLEHELERAQRALQSEQRRVTELERERELQNRTLQVLHQQLEMAKEGRRATRS